MRLHTKLIHVICIILRFVPDKMYLRIKWLYRMGYLINFNNLQTFNEKLQWLKLYDRNPLYTQLVDKFLVKEYVANKIGESHVIKVLDSWNNVDDIKWDSLPNKFVIKCSHDCGGMIICKDKSKLNVELAKKNLRKAFNSNYYYDSREWPYKNVQKRIFCEEYKEDSFNELRDYKFFCFNGEVKAMFIASNRQLGNDELRFDFFDSDFQHLPFTQGHINADVIPDKPKCFEQMKEFASILSKDIPHVRVDFYEVDGHVYFGEMTFFHFSGMVPFSSKLWDYKLGEYIQLPK